MFGWDVVEGAEFYRLYEDANGSGQYVQIGDDLSDTTTSWVVPLHLRASASYYLEACDSDGCTASDPVAVASSMTEAVGYVKASHPGAYDWFGSFVDLSADGNTLVVGAPGEGSNATGIDGDATNNDANMSGAAYVYEYDQVAGKWSQTAYVKASNSSKSASFGSSVALSADGNLMAVGAPFEDSGAAGINGDQADDSTNSAGAVYLFERNGGEWTQIAYIKASNPGEEDWFGYGLALSSDGNTLAVGAPREGSSARGIDGDQDDESAPRSGAVYVFERNAGAWAQAAYVKASNTDEGPCNDQGYACDGFGWAVALSSNGSTLAVGAYGEASSATGIDGDQTDESAPNSGAVYVFDRSEGAWDQSAYLKASNTSTNDNFGGLVALSGDGNTLAVGATYEDSAAQGVNGNQANESVESSGAAYVFERSAGQWSQSAYVKASNTGEGDWFGVSVELSSDGSMLAVAALTEASNATGINGDQTDDSAIEAGAVYIFDRSDVAWTQVSYVKASNTGDGDWFGMTVALSSDGSTLAVGAVYEAGGAAGLGGDQSNDDLSSSGAVYLY